MNSSVSTSQSSLSDEHDGLRLPHFTFHMLELHYLTRNPPKTGTLPTFLFTDETHHPKLSSAAVADKLPLRDC